MNLTIRLVLSFLVIMAIISPASYAAAQAPVFVFLEWVDTSAFPQVTLYLSAWDSSGLPLTNLPSDAFLLQEDGGEAVQTFDLVMDNQAKLSVVLGIDISGSMVGQPLQDAQAAAARFLDRLNDQDQVAILAFSDDVDPHPHHLDPQHELAFTSDLTAVYDLVENLKSEDQTHLYNAAAKAVRWFEDVPPGHRAILLLTDGRNEPPEIGDPEEAIRLAQEQRVPVFVIGLGRSIDLQYLQRLANDTGGLFRAAPRSAELAGMYADMSALLKTQYRLTYTSQLPADGNTHHLNLTLRWSQAEAESSIEMGPVPFQLPATATTIPPTAVPETATQTSLPATQPPPPTVAASITPTMLPVSLPQTCSKLDANCPGNILGWVLAAVAAVVLSLGWVWLRRKPAPTPATEQCAKCGYQFKPLQGGACPHCSETRRLPKY